MFDEQSDWDRAQERTDIAWNMGARATPLTEDFCRQMWRAVLERSVGDLRGDAQADKRDAYEWFISPDESSPGAFLWILDHLQTEQTTQNVEQELCDEATRRRHGASAPPVDLRAEFQRRLGPELVAAAVSLGTDRTAALAGPLHPRAATEPGGQEPSAFEVEMAMMPVAGQIEGGPNA